MKKLAMIVVCTLFSIHIALANSGGWVNVPLSNKDNFDIHCEYKVYVNHHDVTGVDMHIATIVKKRSIDLYSGPLFQFIIYSKNKYKLHRTGTPSDASSVVGIEKRCVVNPTHEVVFFHLAKCPDGWDTYSGNNMANQSVNGLVFCEKT